MADIMQMMRMMQEQMSQHSDMARETFNDLKETQALHHWYLFDEQAPRGFCFRLRLINPWHEFDEISISHPPDVHGNTTEFALFLRGELVYSEAAGYDDICRFYSPAEVVAELVRLAEYAVGAAGVSVESSALTEARSDDATSEVIVAMTDKEKDAAKDRTSVSA